MTARLDLFGDEVAEIAQGVRKGGVGVKIELERLELHNFKGARNVLAEFALSTKIAGANGTGKTTFVDAWHWLLFGKDSQNRADFEIKTLDGAGQPTHNLHHEVEGTLSIDGKRLTLKKSYYEKWVKKRGSVSAEHTGHSTDHYIDGVPVKQGEYKDRVASLVDEGIFKLLTSPSYFNEVLSWQDQRRTLFEVCGDVSDAQVIASDDGLQRLPAILSDRSIDDHRKIILAKRTEINREMQAIPTRIDEANRARPDTQGLSEPDLKTQVEEARARRDAKSQEIEQLQNGAEVAQQKKRLAELEGELATIRNAVQAKSSDGVQGQREKVNRIKTDLTDVRTQIEKSEQLVTSFQDAAAENERLADEQRAKWEEVDERAFSADVTDTCPACGQPLPADDVAAAVERARAAFNSAKADDLERITKRGKQAAEMAESEKAKAEKGRARLAVLREQGQALTETLESAQAALDKMTAGVSDVSQDADYIAKQAEIQQTNSRITQLKQSVLNDVEKARQELIDLSDELRRVETKLAAFAQVRKLDARIDQLTKQERDLAHEYELLEEHLYLCDQFVRAKVSLLESKINSKFKMARFRLFRSLVNGGVEETCETTYQGVPFGGGLNRSACILVGLDIIRTLSEHYGVYAPIWIDNAEGINELPEMDSQIISLHVTEDKTLRVETR